MRAACGSVNADGIAGNEKRVVELEFHAVGTRTKLSGLQSFKNMQIARGLMLELNV